MQFTLALAGLIGFVAAIPNPVAAPAPQGVTAAISPASTPAECLSTYNNGATFQIGIVNASTVAKRAIPDGLNPNTVPGNSLILTLNNGLLKDYFGRTGYVAANGQLQFDDPVQTGAIYTAGFSACPNSTLALETAVWYECLSGAYYNLYDDSIAPYCSASYLEIIPYGGDASASTQTVPVSTMVAPTPVTSVTQVADGQLQAATTAPAPVTQITDGQVQAATSPAAVVTQITDGQIQAPTNATTLAPFTGAAPSVGISGSTLALIACAIGFGALL